MFVKIISSASVLLLLANPAARIQSSSGGQSAQKPSTPQPSGSQPRRQAPSRQPGGISVADAMELTNGWALLAEGRADQAALRAGRVLVNNPRSGAALHLSIEAEIARGGSTSALDQYERWLGRRTVEEPSALRRVAQALLYEVAEHGREPAARREALEALAEDGDTAAARTSREPRSTARNRGTAASGDPGPVNALVDDLNRHVDDVRTIDALGSTGSPQAIAPLLEQLKDGRIEVRGAALEALGRIGDRDVVPQIKPFLSDRNIYVRMKAAGALLALDDESGMSLLQDMLAQPEADTRLAAAEILAGRVDSAWLATVRQLTEDSDPSVRAAAARLLAPHEPEVARTVLQSLGSEENAAVRELASKGLSEVMPDDFPSLRALMRNGDAVPRVRAARRVLAITR